MFSLLITTMLAAELLQIETYKMGKKKKEIYKMRLLQAIPSQNMALMLLYISSCVLHAYNCLHLVTVTQFSHHLSLFKLA